MVSRDSGWSSVMCLLAVRTGSTFALLYPFQGHYAGRLQLRLPSADDMVGDVLGKYLRTRSARSPRQADIAAAMFGHHRKTGWRNSVLARSTPYELSTHPLPAFASRQRRPSQPCRLPPHRLALAAPYSSGPAVRSARRAFFSRNVIHNESGHSTPSDVNSEWNVMWRISTFPRERMLVANVRSPLGGRANLFGNYS
jgi:hypothetical protein